MRTGRTPGIEPAPALLDEEALLTHLTTALTRPVAPESLDAAQTATRASEAEASRAATAESLDAMSTQR